MIILLFWPETLSQATVNEYREHKLRVTLRIKRLPEVLRQSNRKRERKPLHLAEVLLLFSVFALLRASIYP